MVNYMREHVRQDVRIHYVITNAARRRTSFLNSPNLITTFATPIPASLRKCSNASRRPPKVRRSAQVRLLIMKTSTGFTASCPMTCLGVMDANLRRVGPAAWTAEEMAFAEQLQRLSLGKTYRLATAKEIRKYQFNGQKYSSTDSGDVSWVTPLATLNTVTWVPGTASRTWQATAAGGTGIGLKGLLSRPRHWRSRSRSYTAAPT